MRATQCPAAASSATPPVMGSSALNGECVAITVNDSGEGMDQETLSRAREPFFTTKGIGKGTGLGLSMVYGMTEQLGGRLRIDSLKGKGTSGEMWIPLFRGDVHSPLAVIETRPDPLDDKA